MKYVPIPQDLLDKIYKFSETEEDTSDDVYDLIEGKRFYCSAHDHEYDMYNANINHDSITCEACESEGEPRRPMLLKVLGLDD